MIVYRSISVAAMALFQSFLQLCGTPLHICITSSFSTHLLVSGHLGCFHVLAIVNSTAVTIGMHVSFQIRVFIFSRCMPKNRIAGSYGYSIFSFQKNLHTVFHRIAPVDISTNSVQEFSFLHILSRIYYGRTCFNNTFNIAFRAILEN